MYMRDQFLQEKIFKLERQVECLQQGLPDLTNPYIAEDYQSRLHEKISGKSLSDLERETK